jgi:ABC-2 type transport system permease protein
MADTLIIFRKEIRELVTARQGLRGWGVLLVVYVGVFGMAVPVTQRSLFIVGSPPMAALLFALMGLFIAAPTAADSFAGEFERKTLETLLATRLSDGAIVAGKALAVVSYAWLTVVAVQTVALISLNLSGPRVIYSGTFVLVSVVGPILTAILAAAVGIMLSMWSRSVRTAQQWTGLAMMGLAISLVAFSRRILVGSSAIREIALLGGVLLLAAVLALLLAVASFQRGRLIAVT